MRSIKIIAILFALSIAFGGCKKEVLKVHPELEGIWTSESYTPMGRGIIVIESDGDGSCEISATSTKEKGKAKIKNDVLRIGNAEFKIFNYPVYDNDGNYYLVTDKGKFFGVYAPKNPQASSDGLFVTFSWMNMAIPSDWVDNKQVDFRRINSNTWTSYSFSGNPSNMSISGIQHGTYEWRMKSVRGPNSSQYSQVQTQNF